MFFCVNKCLLVDAGSVDEVSTKSDEEYDDLAMRDGMEMVR
jgi:hypothetical protein